MPTKPIGPNFWTMSCCIFAISLSADCLTDDSKSQSTPSSELFARFSSHRLSVYHISSFVLVYPPCWSLLQSFWIFNCISFHNLAFHSPLAIASSTSCVWHRVQVRGPSAHHASSTKVHVLSLESWEVTPNIQKKAIEILARSWDTLFWKRWKNPQLLIDVSFARTQRWRRFSSRRRTLQSKDDFKLRFSKKKWWKTMVILYIQNIIPMIYIDLYI